MFVFPDVPACGWSRARRGGRTARLDQRRLRGARDRARARPQPRPRARRRALVHGRRARRCRWETRARSTGRTIELPQYAIRSTPWAERSGRALVLRQMNMEHKLALGPAAGRRPCRRSAHRAPTTSRPWRRSGPRSRCCRLPKPGGGTTSSSTAGRSAYFDCAGAGVRAACYIHTESPDWRSPISTDHGDSDTALIDMHPGSGVPVGAVGERRDERRPGRSTTRSAASRSRTSAQDASGATLAVTLPADTRASESSRAGCRPSPAARA